jgi:hypothetical protein
VIARKILGTVLAHFLDGEITLPDGQPLFGHSKTIHGVALLIDALDWIGLDWIGLARHQKVIHDGDRQNPSTSDGW